MTNLVPLGSRDILGKTVAIYGPVENPLFLATVVAEGLEHSNHRAMLESVDADEKIKLDPGVSIPYAGGDKEQWFLTEAGLYEVLFLSRKPIAKQFKAEVKKLLHDVRTGKMQAHAPPFPGVPMKTFIIDGTAITDPVEPLYSVTETISVLPTSNANNSCHNAHQHLPTRSISFVLPAYYHFSKVVKLIAQCRQSELLFLLVRNDSNKESNNTEYAIERPTAI
jgi:hypothetical protein